MPNQHLSHSHQQTSLSGLSLKRTLATSDDNSEYEQEWISQNPRKRQCTPDPSTSFGTPDPSHLSPITCTHPNSQHTGDFDREWSASPSQFSREFESTSPPTPDIYLEQDKYRPGSLNSPPAPNACNTTNPVALSPGSTGAETHALEEDHDGLDSNLKSKIPIRCDDVCIGMILSPPINLNLNSQNSQDPKQPFPVFLGPKSTHDTLPVCMDSGTFTTTLGSLDQRTSQILQALLDRDLVRIQACVDPTHHRNAKTENIELCINLYTNDKAVETLGEFLQKNRIYLQHPVLPLPDIPYRNPHFLTKPGTTLTTTTLLQQYNTTNAEQSCTAPRTDESLKLVSTLNAKGDFEKLLDTIGQTPHVFEPITQSPDIKTQLLPHQLDALSFMIQRERPRQFDNTTRLSSCGLWKQVANDGHDQNLYQNIITGNTQATPPRESPGGLLADHMGLGKTLSVLSLIVHTLPTQASNSNQGIDPAKVNTTLVVTKKSVLPQWDEQARYHIEHGRLRTLTYYGGNLKSNGVNEIAGYDVVFTTYETVKQEWNRSKTQVNGATNTNLGSLHQVSWFRVVLDEGHEIRNCNTGKARAINALSAERRWCVTGTPIQNSLKDLVAIFKFLCVEPFNNYNTLRDHILNPLKREDPRGVGKLRSLIEAFTLRRVKGTVELPPRATYTKLVELHPTERSLYKQHLQESKYTLDGAIESKDKVHASSALEVILRLRLICDHGVDLLPRCDGSEDTQTRELLIEDVAIESQVYDTADDFADKLSSAYNPLSLYQDLYGNASEIRWHNVPKINVMHPCDDDGDVRMSDTGWTLQREQSYMSLDRTPNNVHAKFPFYKGPSSKVRALMDVLQNPQDDWRHVNGPIKSVVFSVWTRMLDLVSIAFDNHGIKYCRLDGSMSATARNSSLAQFKDDPEITVILVSLMAGGVGLNLTVASQVHLLEPHWNPMIEEQALDRVHRIGQRNNVQVFRYLVKDSFENSVMELQKKKLGLARLGMDKLTRQDLRIEKLKEIRALFD